MSLKNKLYRKIIESDFPIPNNHIHYRLNISRPKPTRWNRKYTEVAQFYYTWESQWGVMNIALNEYDCKFMVKDVPIPTL